MNRLSAATTILLLAALVFCALVALRARQSAAQATRASGLPAPGVRVPKFAGYTLTRTRVAAPTSSPCTIIHYTSRGCEYCRAEASIFHKIARRATESGCTVDTIVPDAGIIAASTITHNSSATPPIVFIPYSWGVAVPLRTAPSTLLISRNQRVVWSRAGALDQASASGLLRAISTMIEQ